MQVHQKKKKRIEQINVQVSLPTQGLSTLGLDKVMRLCQNVQTGKSFVWEDASTEKNTESQTLRL